MQPETRYADARGARIAYQVFGEHPPTLVASAGSFSHTDVIWEDPAAALFFTRLASFSRVIRYDRLGTSNSDPFPPDWDPGWRGYVRELEAILDTVGVDRVAIVAILDAGPPAIRFAAEHPERVEKLVLYNTTARFLTAPDYPIGLPEQAIDGVFDLLASSWGREDLVAANVPSRAGDDRFATWYGKFTRAIGTPNTMASTIRRMLTLDVRPYLSRVSVPTLVIHRAHYQMVPVSHGRYLAAHIHDAGFVEVAGADGPAYWEGQDEIVGHIRAFLAGDRASGTGRRAMATILFTDIVESTQRAGEMGDQEWTAVLDVHEELTRGTVAAFGGRFVKSTGDGLLATFDDPGQAVACALRLRSALGDMGVRIRAGLHTGQIELRQDDIGGLAVHLASRVMSEAGDGHIVVSRTVRDLLLGSRWRFTSTGSRPLKGMEGEWELFEVADAR